MPRTITPWRRARFTASLLAVALLLLLPVTALRAQPVPSKAPDSTHIFPAGGRRGTTVQLRVGAECIPPGAEFFCRGRGVDHRSPLLVQIPNLGEPSPRRLPTEVPIRYPREWKSEMTIAADAAGVVYWQVSCAQGGTRSRPFVIGDLPEFIEKESNSTRQTAEDLTLPVTVNGQISGERDIDFYRLSLTAGDLVCCEVMARRIGSRLEPVISILDADGRPLTTQRDHLGNDPVVAFRAPRTGTYYLQIKNVSFHGDLAHVYRINLEKGKFARYCHPLVAQQGIEQSFSLIYLAGDGTLAQLEQSIAVPANATTLQITHPELANTLTIPVDSQRHIAEAVENDTAETAMPLALGSSVDGQLSHSRDQDWFQLDLAAGQAVELVLQADPRVSRAMLVMEVFDDKGGQKFKSTPSGTNQGPVRFLLPASTTGQRYRVQLRDLRLGSAGGAEFSYCLAAMAARPDYQLEISQDFFNVCQGKDLSLEVVARRSGGNKEPIELTLEGLPEGVTVEQATIAGGQSKATIKLTVPAETASRFYQVRVLGRCTVGETVIQRVARLLHAGRDGTGIAIDEPYHEQLGLTVTHVPVFRLFCNEAYLYAHRGSIFPYRMEVERIDGFDAPITLQVSDRQNRDLDGIQMIEVEISPASSETRLPIYLPETMHINVQSQSQLYCQGKATFTDKHGVQQHVLVVSEKRNMLRTLPPVVKLEAAVSDILARPGETTWCELELNRTSNFPGGMTVSLRPGHPAAISMKDISVAAGQTRIRLPLQLAADCEPGSRFPVTIRGQGPLESDPTVTVVTETVLQVTVSDK